MAIWIILGCIIVESEDEAPRWLCEDEQITITNDRNVGEFSPENSGDIVPDVPGRKIHFLPDGVARYIDYLYSSVSAEGLGRQPRVAW